MLSVIKIEINETLVQVNIISDKVFKRTILKLIEKDLQQDGMNEISSYLLLV